MAIEYLEVTIPVKDVKATRKIWKRLGCRCLRRAWAEPWVDDEHGHWYSYHLMGCPVAKRVIGMYN